MRLTVLELECKNIRKISSLKLAFHKNEQIFKNNFIMMANGTGKTTIMQLIKGLLDGSAVKWSAEKIKEFGPLFVSSDFGEFSFTVKFDNKQYKYILILNYKEGTAKIETVLPSKGRESGIHLPDAIKGIFTQEFVSRFVFDGEQAKKTLDRTSNEAEETIRYLYRLDELDAILSMNNKILEDIQNAEGGIKGTNNSISNLRTRKDAVEKTIKKLDNKRIQLSSDLITYRTQLKEKKEAISEIHEQFEELNGEKQKLIEEDEVNRSEINSCINNILNLIKSPYLIDDRLSKRMLETSPYPKTVQKISLLS